VACYSRAVHQHHVIANDAVVANVRVRHDQDVAANLSDAAAFCGSAIQRDVLADLVMVADLETCRLALIGNVLRRHTNRTKGKESVVGANFRRALDRDVRDQVTVLSEVDIRTNYAVRANLARRGNLCPWIDNGRGVDVHEGLNRAYVDASVSAAAARTVDQLAGNDGFRYALVADPGIALHPGGGHPWNRAPAGDFDFQPQLIARTDGLAEFGAVDSGKDHDLVAAVFDFGQQQCAASLRNGLDNQHAGHDGQAGKMSGEERLVNRHVLDGDNSLFSLEFQHPVDQQHRIAVR
jgi:hypothetical protein